MHKFFCLLMVLSVDLLNAQQVTLFDESLNKFQNVRDFCITQSGDEAYFTIQSPNQDLSQIVCMKRNAQGWGSPELLTFCNEFTYMEPFLFNGDKQLYFVSDRPLNDTDTSKKDFDIWVVERMDKQRPWSKPINLGAPVNTALDEFYPTLSANKNLYFTLDANTGMGKDDIYVCKWNGSCYATPELLDSAINSEGHEFNAFISSDETHLMYTKYNAKDGFGSGDLYVAKRNLQGQWQAAKNLGKDINTKFMEYCPFYDVRNGILYFTSRRSSLKPKKFNSLTEYERAIEGAENGLSKIYMCRVKIF